MCFSVRSTVCPCQIGLKTNTIVYSIYLAHENVMVDLYLLIKQYFTGAVSVRIIDLWVHQLSGCNYLTALKKRVPLHKQHSISWSSCIVIMLWWKLFTSYQNKWFTFVLKLKWNSKFQLSGLSTGIWEHNDKKPKKSSQFLLSDSWTSRTATRKKQSWQGKYQLLDILSVVISRVMHLTIAVWFPDLHDSVERAMSYVVALNSVSISNY
jgi:hypothetical protein